MICFYVKVNNFLNSIKQNKTNNSRMFVCYDVAGNVVYVGVNDFKAHR
jgi:hypothetical protein